MKSLSKKITIILFIALSLNSFSQNRSNNYNAVDEYVQKLGSLDSLNMGTIAEIVTKSFDDKKEKVRAIFDWIAYNISYDCKAGRSGNTQKNSSTEVLLYRKAIGMGYASLFQDMCSSANIRCLTADGFVKTNIEMIGETKPDINHRWAVVQLGQSPDEWYYVDACWGSGYTDADMKVFTKSFNGDYFFADRTIFNWQHYPDNDAWKLGNAPKTKSEFYDLPLIKSAAYEFKLTKFAPYNGHIKMKVDKIQPLVFSLDNAAVISKVTLISGERKKLKQEDVNFSFEKGMLKINCKFKEEGTYPLTVMINGKELITYLVDVD